MSTALSPSSNARLQSMFQEAAGLGFLLGAMCSTPSSRAGSCVDCCYENKIKSLYDAVKSMGLSSILTGIKRCAGYSGGSATVEEVRKTYDGVEYVQINPLLEWGERDVRAFPCVNAK